MGVIAAQLFGQPCFVILLARPFDARHSDVFDEDVRGFQYEPGRRIGKHAGVENGDRSAIAVAQQHRPCDSGLPENFGKYNLSLIMHVENGARLFKRV